MSNMYKVQAGDLASQFNKLKSNAGSSNSNRPLSTFAHKEKGKENLAHSKPNIINKVDRERPMLPTRTDSISEQNLKQFKLKKTGIDLSNKVEASPTNDNSNNCESVKKPVGKINMSMFEELQSTVSSSKLKDQSLQRNSLQKSKPGVISPRPIISQKPQNTTNIDNLPLPPEHLLQDEDEIYDTAENVVPNEIIHNFEKGQTSTYQGDTVTDEIYDDVESPPPPPHPTIKPKPKPNPKPFIPDKASLSLAANSLATVNFSNVSNEHAIEEEIYDDIDTSAQSQVEEEIYDDIETSPQLQVEEEIYDDIEPSQEIKTSSYPAYPSAQSVPQIPIGGNKNKAPYLIPAESEAPAKTFGQLESYRFAVPVCLADWMHEIVSSNKSKLQDLGMTAYFPNSHTYTSQDLKLKDEDSVSITSTDSKGKPEKDNKKERRRKEKEKKAKEQQMKKDLKLFSLDINKERTILASVVACTESNGSKKDLAFTHGDEINILKTTHACPHEKCLAQNITTNRIGYILKEEFNLGNLDDIEPAPRGRVKSIIPTVDSDEEDDKPSPARIAPRPVGAPQLPVIPQSGRRPGAPPQPIITNSALPPPLPQTPRPIQNPALVSEEIYDDIVDGLPPEVGGEIYEDIGESLMKREEVVQEEIYDDIA